MFYFAYGSNLSIQNRIKNKINIIKVKNYKLKGYKICFRDPYGDPDIEKSSKSFVPGVLYKFNSIEEMKLDKYENFPLYYKKTFSVDYLRLRLVLTLLFMVLLWELNQ